MPRAPDFRPPILDRMTLVRLYGMRRLTLEEVGQALGVSRETVRRALAREGIRRRRRGWRRPDEAIVPGEV